MFRDMPWSLWIVLVCLVLNFVLWTTVIVTRTWEYRAVYHYDCASYMTES